jgi:hypothetical protein
MFSISSLLFTYDVPSIPALRGGHALPLHKGRTGALTIRRDARKRRNKNRRPNQ